MGLNLGFGTFRDTLALAGTPQRLENPGNVPGLENPQISSLTIQALKANLGIIFLGGSSAQALEAEAFELPPGASLSIDIQGAGNIWLNGTSTGDKVAIAWTGP